MSFKKDLLGYASHPAMTVAQPNFGRPPNPQLAVYDAYRDGMRKRVPAKAK